MSGHFRFNLKLPDTHVPSHTSPLTAYVLRKRDTVDLIRLSVLEAEHPRPHQKHREDCFPLKVMCPSRSDARTSRGMCSLKQGAIHLPPTCDDSRDCVQRWQVDNGKNDIPPRIQSNHEPIEGFREFPICANCPTSASVVLAEWLTAIFCAVFNVSQPT